MTSEYYRLHPEKRKEHNRKYFTKHKESIKKYHKKWKELNPGKMNAYGRKWWHKMKQINPKYLKNKAKKYNKKRKIKEIEMKMNLIKIFGSKCKKCGYNKNMAALDFHHIFTKEKNIYRRKQWKDILKNIKNYLLICSNCHKELHNPNLNIRIKKRNILGIEPEKREV